MMIPLSEPGSAIDPQNPGRLAPGVFGYALENEGEVYTPLIHAEHEGSGDVGRFLDALPDNAAIPCVTSSRLIGMLVRRGWSSDTEETEFGPVVVWRRKR